MASLIKICIVEDNIHYREALVFALQQSSQFEIISSIHNVDQIVPEFSRAIPDVVLMDISLKASLSGIEGIKIIKNSFPEVKIIVITVFEDEDKILEAIMAGASGYLLKNTPPDVIFRSILELHQGGAPMSPLIAGKVLELMRNQHAGSKSFILFKSSPPLLEDGPVFVLSDLLTARELQILEELSTGNSYRKIADSLFIHISTVRSHVANIYTKLHVNNKVEAFKKVGIMSPR